MFNIFTQTIFKGIHYSCIHIVLLLRDFAQGKTTLHLSKELQLNYKNLLDWRHRLQEFAYENRDITPLLDGQVESDEVFINAGEKSVPHTEDGDPPRVRANKKKALAHLKTTDRLYRGCSAGKARPSGWKSAQGQGLPTFSL